MQNFLVSGHQNETLFLEPSILRTSKYITMVPAIFWEIGPSLGGQGKGPGGPISQILLGGVHEVPFMKLLTTGLAGEVLAHSILCLLPFDFPFAVLLYF